jgi:nucleoid-associated protein YgaU
MPIRVVLRNAEYFTVDARGNYTRHRGDLYATMEKPGGEWKWQPENAIHPYDLPRGDISRYALNFIDNSRRAANDAITEFAERNHAYHQQHPDAPYIEILELFELPNDLSNEYPPDAIF